MVEEEDDATDGGDDCLDYDEDAVDDDNDDDADDQGDGHKQGNYDEQDGDDDAGEDNDGHDHNDDHGNGNDNAAPCCCCIHVICETVPIQESRGPWAFQTKALTQTDPKRKQDKRQASWCLRRFRKHTLQLTTKQEPWNTQPAKRRLIHENHVET